MALIFADGEHKQSIFDENTQSIGFCPRRSVNKPPVTQDHVLADF